MRLEQGNAYGVEVVKIFDGKGNICRFDGDEIAELVRLVSEIKQDKKIEVKPTVIARRRVGARKGDE